MQSQTFNYSNMWQIIYQYGIGGGCQSGNAVCAESENGWNVGKIRIIQSASGACKTIKQWNKLSTPRTNMWHYDGPKA